MSPIETPRNRLSIPAIGAEVFTYLKDVNDRESFVASRRLKDLLGSNLRSELSRFFEVEKTMEISQSTIRKITNSLLAAGASGNSRTLEALKELDALDLDIAKSQDFLTVTKFLREWSRDYRSAKGSLDNNFKCVNSFLRVQRTANDDTVKALLRKSLSNHSDFIEWTQELRRYWIQKKLVKENLQGAYLGIFDEFIRSFNDDLSNTKLSVFLDHLWLEYLPNEQRLEVASNFDEYHSDAIRLEPLIEKPFEVELVIEKGAINYLIKFFSMNQFQVSQLKFKLALELSKASLPSLLTFRVFLKKDLVPTIAIAVQGEQVESDVSNIVQFLESTLEKAMTIH